MMTKEGLWKRFKNWMIAHFTGEAHNYLPDQGDQVLDIIISPERELKAIMAPLQDMANQLGDFSDRASASIFNLENRLTTLRETNTQALTSLHHLQMNLGIMPLEKPGVKDAAKEATD